MRFVRHITLVLILALGITSCQQTLRDFTRDAVLEVEGVVLYQDEIDDFIPEGISASDSTYLVETFKKQWITRVLVYKMAYKNIGNSAEIKQMADAYQKELTINHYQQQLIAENLNEVSEDSLRSYYQKNKELFLLDEAVIKGIFIKLPSSSIEQEDLVNWLSNTTDENLENIMRYCTQHAVFYEFFLESWTPYGKIAHMLPESVDSNDPALTRGSIKQAKEDYTYYLRITGKCNAGQPQPYEMIRPELQNILLNQEKIKFIQTFQQSLYDKAIANGQIKYFENE
ncbi:MAG: hypothetical protein UHZ06_03040 [Paludibacteraceae bacterium]|jgi:hypothetical protein|nr:hypothetical protein [Paludibacteraceae bacterium]